MTDSAASKQHSNKEASAPLTFALITASDTRTKEEDTAGAALAQLIAADGGRLSRYEICKDNRATISAAIVAACDTGVDIVITCGGTGLSPRDVTPEATADVCDRNVPGIAEAMRAYSLAITKRAMLSRAVCMQRGTTLVVNFPGSEKAVRENWAAIHEQLPHAVRMSAGGGH
ncbi:MAG: MogA/MoaB family molybdenum cofactor biosynthesis protein [Eggerthellaceae bacterium]|jgi:molybdopterin adenylyltransferase